MKILVTGASGQLGSKVLEILSQKYNLNVIAGTRSPEKLKSSKGEVRKVDFDDSTSTDEAFKGIDKLLIISTDSLAVPGLRLKQHLAAIESAKKAGVKHIVYTSLTSAEDSPISFAPDHAGTEKAIKESGLTYTILRNNWYLENLAQVVDSASSGKIFSSTKEGRVGFISRNDCAEVAAHVLASDKYKNLVLDVTNSETYSYQDIAQALHAELVPISSEALAQGLREHKLPEFVVDLFVTYEKAVVSGKLSAKNDFFFEMVGRNPLSLENFLNK